MTTKDGYTCAVAVRDGADLLQVFTIRRAAAGDIYINHKRDWMAGWDPHTSYHASGQHHHKAFNRKLLTKRQLQRPAPGFKGSQNIVTHGISADEPRAIATPCRPSSFDQVFEIPCSDLKLAKYHTYLSDDITDSNAQPIITPAAKILRQAILKDALPWIVLTLFDTSA